LNRSPCCPGKKEGAEAKKGREKPSFLPGKAGSEFLAQQVFSRRRETLCEDRRLFSIVPLIVWRVGRDQDDIPFFDEILPFPDPEDQ